MKKITVVPTRVRIAAELRKSILNGEIKAGEELSLTGTAEKLAVSRTPVREAFQVLSEEGLIRLRMNRSAVVMQIDENYIIDHFETRALLEGEAVARAFVPGWIPLHWNSCREIFRMLRRRRGKRAFLIIISLFIYVFGEHPTAPVCSLLSKACGTAPPTAGG